MLHPQVTLKGIDQGAVVMDEIEAHVEKLKHFERRLNSCRVVVSSPHRHHHNGRIYHVSIQARLGHKPVVVSREPEKNGAHSDLSVALRDAFDAFERKLSNTTLRLRDLKRFKLRH